MKELHIPAGISIKQAAIYGMQKYSESNERLFFNFNDIEIIIGPLSSETGIVDYYTRESEDRRLKYEASPEGKRAEQEVVKRRSTDQENVDDLVAILPSCTDNLTKLLLWFEKFIDSADTVGVKYDKAAIVGRLKEAGYVNNDGVGKPPEHFKNKVNMGRYIVGQCINCMESGMPPHPVVLRFIEDYKKMVDESENLN